LNLKRPRPAEEEVAAPTIHIRNVSLAYKSSKVFSNLSLALPAGCKTALLGPSGVGKSSLLRMIAGLTTQEESMTGEITSDGLPIHQQIAYMAQTDLLLPWLAVLHNATLGISLRNTSREARAKQIEKATALLQQVGLEHALYLFPHQLSGGMRQRVALVRTLMEEKPIVLMDEPFSAVDAITRYKLQALACHLLHDKTVLFITHDPLEALRLANDIYVMHGEPTQIKLVTSLTSPTPRELSDTDMLKLQTLLFHELADIADGRICNG
jgi:putative hydroxymethylpyrimidine transport system ATP-binding protein